MANILIIGSGGREHSIYVALKRSKSVNRVWVAPGNGGTEPDNLIDVEMNKHESIVNACQVKGIDLVVVGPEQPLADGLVDVLEHHNIPAFGPRNNAAIIESSKSFAKDFMIRHAIPTADYCRFKDVEEARIYINEKPHSRLVVKASGLCAGKGVVVAETAEEAIRFVETCLNGAFDDAGNEVIVEERLVGDEISIHALTDGTTVKLMPPAQDHKQLLDGDRGPNTGGMGAYCPADHPLLDLKYIETEIMEKTVQGLKAEGREYRGVLYAGLMLTKDGAKVLEFNCRFGDPETQVLLPLLQSDLYDVLRCCSYIPFTKSLSKTLVQFDKNNFTCSVVCVSLGYPSKYEKELKIEISENLTENTSLIHAGTKIQNSNLLTAGGRVLNCVSVARSLQEARDNATKCASECVKFDGKTFRSDIGMRQSKLHRTYAQSGVSIDAGNELVDLIKPYCQATRIAGCLASNECIIGAFAACFDLNAALGLNAESRPILVMGTDGVGTKLDIASRMNRLDGIGQDVVAMCVNDIACHGATPLCFLDYYVTGKLNVQQAADVIKGIATACKDCHCALVGGETSEMPGVYRPSQWDIAGFAVGAIDATRHSMLPRHQLMREGQSLIGLPSSGLHSNGFSLVRKLFENEDLNSVCAWDSTRSLGEALLTPTELYVKPIQCLIENELEDPLLLACAHITGGGIVENLPRIFSTRQDFTARLDALQWRMPEVFKYLRVVGGVDIVELRRTFNCGIGMLLLVSHCRQASRILTENGYAHFIVGRLEKYNGADSVIVDNFDRALARSIDNEPDWCANNETTIVAHIKTKRKCRIAILISGTGSNMAAIIEKSKYANSNFEIVVVISNKTNAAGIEKATKSGIKTVIIPHKDFASRVHFEQRITEVLTSFNVQLVVLAGFMRILSDQFVQKWSNRIINIHPSLLPSFKGHDAHDQVLKSGVKISGCTVHYVTEDLDGGAIIDQSSCRVQENDTITSLSDRIKNLEHQLYPKCVQKVAAIIINDM